MAKPTNAFEEFLMLKGRILAIEAVVRHSILTSAAPVMTATRLAEYLNEQQAAGENTPVDDWVLIGFQKSVEHMLPKFEDATGGAPP